MQNNNSKLIYTSPITSSVTLNFYSTAGAGFSVQCGTKQSVSKGKAKKLRKKN